MPARHMLSILMAQRIEQERQIRQSTSANVKAALDEVKARRDLGYAPLARPFRKPPNG